MEKPTSLPDSPSFVDLCTLHQHAMRYYRLWIYACNTVLAIATLVFTVFAVSVLVDPRITLLSGVELYQPTFIYAYVALILQCGVLQMIGCLGALRLNQRLLNTYWTLLLLLMIGDIVVGLVWAFRIDRIKTSLKPTLLARLNSSYGVDQQFTQAWDWVQTHDSCCGVQHPQDFHSHESISNNYDGPLFHKLPSTCCTFSKRNPTDMGRTHQSPTNYDPPHSNKRHHHSPLPLIHPLPTSSKVKLLWTTDNAASLRTRPKIVPPSSTTTTKTDKIQNMSSKGGGGASGRWRGRTQVPPTPHHPPIPSSDSDILPSHEIEHVCELPPQLLLHEPTLSIDPTSRAPPTSSTQVPPPKFERGSGVEGYPPSVTHHFHIHLHQSGCVDKVIGWMDHVTDVMFVLGFCIIVFLKGCFLAILRYEIKEMIQKIRLLNGEEGERSAAMNELIGLTSLYNTSPDELPLEQVTGETLELQTMSPHPSTTSVPPHAVPPTPNSASDPPKPQKKGYPPFGNYLNSNNMMYRLQRQMSQQAQHDDHDPDGDSCSALLQLTQRRSQGSTGSSASTDKRNSTSRRGTCVSAPPRNGNNNNMGPTTTALGPSSGTGTGPPTAVPS